MKKLLLLVGVLGLLGPPALAIDFYVTPDVPVDLPGVGTALPWTVARHNTPFTYTTALVQPLLLPFNTHPNALYLKTNGDWLFSVEVPTDLGGTTYLPEDVVLYDTSGIYSAFFCGNPPPLSIPSGSDVDAAFLVGHRDDGNLVLSFEVPTTIGGTTYDPSDLIEFQFVGPNCQDWSVAGLFFDASGATPPVPRESNVTGADERATGKLVLTFDIPTTLGGTTYVPGELVQWDPTLLAFSSLHKDAGWSVGGRANGVSHLAAAGTIPPSMRVDKASGGQITVDWSTAPSCSVGAEDYGVYEGAIGTWYSHGPVTCTDAGGDLKETFTPASGNTYYLVVPNNPDAEGSYGSDSSGLQRPQQPGSCRVVVEIGCP